MQLVIDLPEEEYNLIMLKQKVKVGGVTSEAEKYIVNGIPLPKGHGRLIDGDKLEEELGWLEKVTNESSMIEKAEYRGLMDGVRIVKQACTILEADKEVSE